MRNVIKNCDSNGVRIAYRVEGEGEPLVLIMGLGASSLKWAPHVAAYAPHFRTIAVDNRGAGLSDSPAAERYSIADMARDVVAVMDAEGIESAHVNGISMGGAIAQRLAIDHPGRVRSLILTNTFPRCNVSFRRAIELLRDACGAVDGHTFTRLCQWIIYAAKYQDEHEEALLDAEAHDPDAACPMSSAAYRAQCNAILDFDVSKELGRITAPTLIAAGDSDLFVPPWITREMAEGIPGAELFVAPDGGHVQHWEQLEQYNRVTLDFLLRHAKQD